MTFDLLFTKVDGFSEYTLPDALRAEEREDEEDWLKRVGYTKRVWEFGDPNGTNAVAREYKGGSDVPRYLVTFWDSSYGIGVYVPDAASLFTLRLQLAQAVHAELVADYLPRFERLVERSYQLLHGHDADEVCPRCDPLHHRTQTEK